MEFPIVVNEVQFEEQKPIRFFFPCGQMVSIRPCAEKYKKKTFLGIFIGEVPTDAGAKFKAENKVMSVFLSSYNPLIFIPELNEVVFGFESWWGEIKNENQLKEITDEDISNVWYVKALKQISKFQKDIEKRGEK